MIQPVIGEYDDPSSQNQYVLTVPFSKSGNVLIYGIAGAGKEMFLTSLIYSCMTSYSPEEVNFYILDFGAETLRVFHDSPYVGDIAYVNDEDKVKNLFKMLNGELETRRELFANYGGSYQSYIASGVGQLPNYIVLINNYEAFVENYEVLSDELIQLSRDAFKYGVYFVLTANSDNSVRIKTKQNFAIVYALQQNNDMDYSSILGNVRGKFPAKCKGRGLFRKDEIFEFQTAFVTEENENKYLTQFCQSVASSVTYRARKIPVLPKVVDYESVRDAIVVDSPSMVVGINKNTLNVEKYNFKKNAIQMISSYEIENTFSFVNSLVDEVAFLGQYEIIFVNTTEDVFANPTLQGKICTKNFDEIMNKITRYVGNVYEAYENSQYNDALLLKQKKFMIFIYGVNDFIHRLNDENKKNLATLMKQDNQIGIVSFVLIDIPDVLKGYAYEDWFKSGADTSRGMWIGSGIAEQSLFKVTKMNREDREDISNEYGYVIQSSKLYKVKFLNEFNKKD